ncbi:MAG: hypothetical protein SFX72_03170 [Isosphaeraceae bacterium]|nr:hypothetical protein [Isosphaeraceae bacterium]
MMLRLAHVSAAWLAATSVLMVQGCSPAELGSSPASRSFARLDQGEVILAECEDGGLDAAIRIVGKEAEIDGRLQLVSIRAESVSIMGTKDRALEEILGRHVAVKSILHHSQESSHQKRSIDGSVDNITLEDGTMVGLSAESFFPYYYSGVHVIFPGEKSPASSRTYAATSHRDRNPAFQEACKFPLGPPGERYRSQSRDEPELEKMSRNPKVVQWGDQSG